MSETQWLTLLETADLMKKLPTQVTRMCEDGKLEYYREDGKHYVSRESINLFLNSPNIGASGRYGTIPWNPGHETKNAGHSRQESDSAPQRNYGQAPEAETSDQTDEPELQVSETAQAEDPQ